MSNNENLNRQVRKYENRIQFIVEQRFNQKVNQTMKRIEQKLFALQQEFFTTLAMKTIGVDGPPKLGAYTPAWKPLDDEYMDQREFDKDVPHGKFFQYSGALGEKLGVMNATTFFGKPLVLYKRGKFEQKPMESYSKPNPNKMKDHLTAVISIDLFPKVVGSIDDIDVGDLFSRVKVRDKRGSKSTSTPLAYRLKNFQGRNERPVVVEFMNWWLNIKARKIVRETAGL